MTVKENIIAAARHLAERQRAVKVVPVASRIKMETPKDKDVFQYYLYESVLAKKWLVVWDYRDNKGVLHSGVAQSPDEAIQAATEFGYKSAAAG